VCACVTSHTRFPWSQLVSCGRGGGGGYRVNVVTLHYDEVSSYMKIKVISSTCNASEWVSEWVTISAFKLICISPDNNIRPYELLSPTNAGNNMAGTRTYAVDLSQYLTNLVHKICFTIIFISCLYMFRAHVFIIIRRSKLHYTASGIITSIGVMILPDDKHMCSKHVEAWNKTYCETNFVHQVG